MTDEAEFTEPDPWPDPVLRERVARALSWHSDGQHRDDYQHFRGYWLGAADMALGVSGLAEALAERDRARDVAVALEQEASVYGATSRAFGDDPDGEDDEDDPTIDRNPAGELDRFLGQEAEQQDNADAAQHGPTDDDDAPRSLYCLACGGTTAKDERCVSCNGPTFFDKVRDVQALTRKANGEADG